MEAIALNYPYSAKCPCWFHILQHVLDIIALSTYLQYVSRALFSQCFSISIKILSMSFYLDQASLDVLIKPYVRFLFSILFVLTHIFFTLCIPIFLFISSTQFTPRCPCQMHPNKMFLCVFSRISIHYKKKPYYLQQKFVGNSQNP